MFSTILRIWRKNRTLLNLESMLHCLNFVDKDWLINSKLSQGFFQLKVYNFNGCALRKILGSPMLCIWVTQGPQLMISTQKLRFPSHPRAKVWHQGPTGAEHYAPINVNPAGAGSGGGGRAWVGIWHFSKICSQIPSPRAIHSSQMQPNLPTPGCT